VVDLSHEQRHALFGEALVHEAHLAQHHERERTHGLRDKGALFRGASFVGAERHCLLEGQVRGKKHPHEGDEGRGDRHLEHSSALAGSAIVVGRKTWRKK